MPTSWIPRLSRAVSGRAVAGWFDLDVFLERSSLLGRGRELGMLGDAGSFLTMIFGLGVRPPARDALGGDDLEVAAPALGLLLVDD